MLLLDLSSAMEFLNITSADYADELQSMIDATEAIIGKRGGPLESTTITVRVAGGLELVLPVVSVISLTSVTPVCSGAASLDVSQLDSTNGVVGWNGYLAGFCVRSYLLVCEVGHGSDAHSVPTDLLIALKELLRHLWSSQRGSAKPGTHATPAPFMLPYRVQSLLEHRLRADHGHRDRQPRHHRDHRHAGRLRSRLSPHDQDPVGISRAGLFFSARKCLTFSNGAASTNRETDRRRRDPNSRDASGCWRSSC